jgi:hypothetical protein
MGGREACLSHTFLCALLRLFVLCDLCDLAVNYFAFVAFVILL